MQNPLGGRPTQDYLLTVHGFKQLCMAADTVKSREVREYYLAMEGVMLEHTRRKMAAACEAERSARALAERVHPWPKGTCLVAAPTMEEALPTCSILSRRRYRSIEEHVRSVVAADAADSIMRHICATMRFDPEVGMVTPRRAHNMRARVQRIAAEFGVPIGVANRGRGAASKAHKDKTGGTGTIMDGGEHVPVCGELGPSGP